MEADYAEIARTTASRRDWSGSASSRRVILAEYPREMLLTKSFPPDAFTRALESWSWLDLSGKSPVLASLFGDVFLQDPEGYWFLDSLEGGLSRVAATTDELQAILGTPEGQDRYLLAGLAHSAEREGMRLEPNEVYDFSTPPVLGGTMDISNVSPRDFVVSLNIAGQIHDQVRRLPPGTRITGFQIGE